MKKYLSISFTLVFIFILSSISVVYIFNSVKKIDLFYNNCSIGVNHYKLNVNKFEQVKNSIINNKENYGKLTFLKCDYFENKLNDCEYVLENKQLYKELKLDKILITKFPNNYGISIEFWLNQNELNYNQQISPIIYFEQYNNSNNNSNNIQNQPKIIGDNGCYSGVNFIDLNSNWKVGGYLESAFN